MEAKPVHAGAYFLTGGVEGRWPRLGGYTLDPFELDSELPSDTYRIYFTSTATSGMPLPTSDGRPSPAIEWTNPKTPARSAEEDEESQEEDTEALSELAPEAAPQKPVARVEVKTDDPAYRRHRREVEQERFARDIAENRLLLGSRMRHAGESAELLVVMKAYRAEMEKMARMPISLSLEYSEAARRSHAEYQAVNADLVKELKELRKQQPAAAAPSLLQSIVSPEGLGLVKVLAEVFLGKADDDDTVTATAEDPALQKLRKKRDEARAKLRRLQAAAGKAATSSSTVAKSETATTEPSKKRPPGRKDRGKKSKAGTVKGKLTDGSGK